MRPRTALAGLLLTAAIIGGGAYALSSAHTTKQMVPAPSGPPPVPVVADAVIDELRQCFETEDAMDVEESIRPGVEVTVAQGSFLGFRGIVVRLMPSRQRVQILLDFLGRTTVAEVERTALILEDRCVADLVPSLAMSPRRCAGAVG